MILVSTLAAETGRLDREIATLTRARFAALARCDAYTARRVASEVARLKTQRADLIHGQPLFPISDE